MLVASAAWMAFPREGDRVLCVLDSFAFLMVGCILDFDVSVHIVLDGEKAC